MTKPTRKTRGRYDKKSPRFGFHEWNLDAIEHGATQLLNRAFKEALDIATEEYEVYAEFLYGEGQKNVGVMEIGLPLGPEEYENPIWRFELSELVTHFIFDPDPEDIPRLAALRDHMRKEADRIDQAINNLGKPPD